MGKSLIEGFFIYGIFFDQDNFGLYATKYEADQELAKQIEQGGPAWEDCDVKKLFIPGQPEILYA